jgi:hypothetical protein
MICDLMIFLPTMTSPDHQLHNQIPNFQTVSDLNGDDKVYLQTVNPVKLRGECGVRIENRGACE